MALLSLNMDHLPPWTGKLTPKLLCPKMFELKQLCVELWYKPAQILDVVQV